jgi:hypothetical protein
VSFELIAEAYDKAGLAPTALGAVAEGLSSAAGMRRAGRSRAYVFGLWGGVAVISGLAAVAGCTLLGGVPPPSLPPSPPWQPAPSSPWSPTP